MRFMIFLIFQLPSQHVLPPHTSFPDIFVVLMVCLGMDYGEHKVHGME